MKYSPFMIVLASIASSTGCSQLAGVEDWHPRDMQAASLPDASFDAAMASDSNTLTDTETGTEADSFDAFIDVSPEADAPPAICQAGEYRCLSSALQRCSDSQSNWNTMQTCSSAALCDAKLPGCHTCLVGQTRCDAAQLRTCNSTQDGWSTVQTCVTAGLCDSNAATCKPPVCDPGQHQCSGDFSMVCNQDQTGWSKEKHCSSCDSDAGTCL